MAATCSSDFWTSLGIVVGLAARPRDRPPPGSILRRPRLVALNLLWTGVRLLRQAASGLLDEEDTALLDRLLRVLDAHVGQGVIRVHHLRAIRSGRFHHVDADLVVPEFWSVERAHDLAERLALEVMERARRGRGARVSRRSLSPGLLRHVRSRRLSGPPRALPGSAGPDASTRPSSPTCRAPSTVSQKFDPRVGRL